MFILTTISDVIQIQPIDFAKPSAQALEDNINEKYANRVIQKVGLCICFYDLLSASEGLIGHGEGTVNVKSEFRLVIFRPFKGEIIEGKISEVTATGLGIHLEFFDDIHAPITHIFEEASFNPRKHEMLWINKDENGEVLSTHCYERNDRCRFRVEEEIWEDLDTSEDNQDELGLMSLAATNGNEADANKKKSDKDGRPAWRLVVSMAAGGLGMVDWW